MKLLVEWGEFFIQSMGAVGDFLLNQPFRDLDNIYRFGAVLNGTGINKEMYEFLMFVSDLSVAQIILGTSLIGILTFKIFKFILDIIF